MLIGGVASAMALQSCSLDEVNPGGFTFENISYSPEGYETLLNQCFFGLERKFYNDFDYMAYMEANTDLWTVAANQLGKNDHTFRFFASASPNTTFTDGIWNSAYDGIGACNTAIALVKNPRFASEEVRAQKEAVARFLRAVYYYNLVEMFGGVVISEYGTPATYTPVRSTPLEVYQKVIIPDLEFAVANLAVGDYTNLGVPTKKSALGFLAKACAATRQYGSDEFLARGYEAAKTLIDDCEAGGAKYFAYMYPTVGEVFAEKNNKANKEALWKYMVYAGADNHGSSNGNYRTNRNDEHFLCQLNKFGARKDIQASRLEWDGGVQGDFMPTAHLLDLFVQADGSLDPRFHANFVTEWKANNAYKWTTGDIANYGKDASKKDSPIAVGDLAVKFVMPQDADYTAEMNGKATSNHLLVSYGDVYASKRVTMTNGSGENMYRYFYPSLSKHNSSNYYVANASKMRNGNLNAVLVMRMAEVYLLAAEYDIILKGGANAMGYINKVRTRAGAKALTGAATMRTVLDERARELCGEFTRFFDLKRTGMFKDASYLMETHPELAQHFKPEYALRPISTNFLNVITNGDDFRNPGY